MKKIILIFATIFLATNSFAKDGFYIGADLLRANTRQQFKYISGTTDVEAMNRQAMNTSAGVDAGYRLDLCKGLFLAPEIFYDHLGVSSRDFFEESSPHDRIKIKNRYGAKLNLGYDITSKFNIFVNAGLTNIRYVNAQPSSNASRGAYKIAMIYGFGAAYNLTDNFALRTSYDHQQFGLQYVFEGQRSNTKLDVVKIGVVYSF